jgi:hypothetical protein
MRWAKLLGRYSLVKKPTLKAVNPRVGMSIIPLDKEDHQLFYQYLMDKHHALHFEGSEKDLTSFIADMSVKKGFTVKKIRASAGRGREKLILLHLKFSEEFELRRLIRLA